MYASGRGRKLEPNNLKGTKLGSPSWESGPESGPHREIRVRSRTQSMLRAAYSSLRLQSRVLMSQSGNGIWRCQDWHASTGAELDLKLCFRKSNLDPTGPGGRLFLRYCPRLTQCPIVRSIYCCPRAPATICLDRRYQNRTVLINTHLLTQYGGWVGQQGRTTWEGEPPQLKDTATKSGQSVRLTERIRGHLGPEEFAFKESINGFIQFPEVLFPSHPRIPVLDR